MPGIPLRFPKPRCPINGFKSQQDIGMRQIFKGQVEPCQNPNIRRKHLQHVFLTPSLPPSLCVLCISLTPSLRVRTLSRPEHTLTRAGHAGASRAVRRETRLGLVDGLQHGAQPRHGRLQKHAGQRHHPQTDGYTEGRLATKSQTRISI